MQAGVMTIDSIACPLFAALQPCDVILWTDIVNKCTVTMHSAVCFVSIFGSSFADWFKNCQFRKLEPEHSV